MNYKENNREIALFLGWKEQTDPNERWFGQFFNSHGERKGGSLKEPLLFHCDWNWLMEVVEEIENADFYLDSENAVNITIGATLYCTIYDSFGEELEIIGQKETKLLSVYDAVLKFIKHIKSIK